MGIIRGRKGLTAILAWAFALGACAALCASAPLPLPPSRWVTDGPGALEPATRDSLDSILGSYEKATGRQVLVWIGDSTGDQPLEEWCARTFESWGVGRRKLDDGLVIFLFQADRKVRIEVGYGLEEKIPDAVASRILREAILPRLQAGDWDAAVSEGVRSTLAALDAPSGFGAGAAPGVAAPPGPGSPRSLSAGQMVLFGILALGFLILLVTNPSLALWLLFSILSGGRGGGGGGGFSGGGGRSGGGGASGSW